MKNKVVAKENEKDLVKLLQQYKILKDYMKKIKRNTVNITLRLGRLARGKIEDSRGFRIKIEWHFCFGRKKLMQNISEKMKKKIEIFQYYLIFLSIIFRLKYNRKY